MDFQARCIQFLGETSGVSKVGNPWKKKEWVVETYGQFPKKVKIQCFGERSSAINLEPGRDYTLSVDLESREFNGRWYTDVSVYRVEEAVPGMGQPMMGQPNMGGMGNPNMGGMGVPQSPVNPPYGDNFGSPFPGNDNLSPAAGEEDLPF